jgi:hypothetical protein
MAMMKASSMTKHRVVTDGSIKVIEAPFFVFHESPVNKGLVSIIIINRHYCHLYLL